METTNKRSRSVHQYGMQQETLNQTSKDSETIKRFKILGKDGQCTTATIEQFSAELFYEIFDYLNTIDIFYSFINMNIKMNHIIEIHLLRTHYLDLTSGTAQEILQSEQYHQQRNLLNRLCSPNQIKSLKLSLSEDTQLELVEPFFTDMLASLTLTAISQEYVDPIIEQLSTLEQLKYLKINGDESELEEDSLNMMFKSVLSNETFQDNLKTFVLIHNGSNFDPENSALYCELSELPMKPFIALEHLKLRTMDIKTFFEMLQFVPNLKSLEILHLIDINGSYSAVLKSTKNVKLLKLKNLNLFIDLANNDYVQKDLFENLITKMPMLVNLKLSVKEYDIGDSDGNPDWAVALKYCDGLKMEHSLTLHCQQLKYIKMHFHLQYIEPIIITDPFVIEQLSRSFGQDKPSASNFDNENPSSNTEEVICSQIERQFSRSSYWMEQLKVKIQHGLVKSVTDNGVAECSQLNFDIETIRD